MTDVRPPGHGGRADHRREADRRPAPRRRSRPRPSRRRPTWRRSPPTASAARPASTFPATRAGRAPTRECAWPSASGRCCSTSPRTSRESTSVRRRRLTSGPSELAAEAYGAERAWFLTNGATQGNHALCLAMAAAGNAGRAPAQLPRQHDRRADPERRRSPPGWRPSTTRSWAWPTASRRSRWRQALKRTARGAVRVHRLAHLLRHGGRHRGLRRGRPRRGRGARGRQRLGLAFRFSPPAAAIAARAGGRRDARLDPQDRRQPDPVGDAAWRRRATGSTSARVARAVRLVRSTSPSALLMASLDAARRQLAVHGEALLERTIAAAERARDGDRRGARLLGGGRGAGWPARGRRLGPAAHRDRRARDRLHRLRRGGGAALELRHLRRAGDARDARARAGDRSADRAARAAGARLRRDGADRSPAPGPRPR